MGNEIVNFMYAAVSSSVGSAIYEGLKNILSTNELDNLNQKYQNENIKEFEKYSLKLLEDAILKQKIFSLKDKTIFDDAEIKVIGKTSKIDIDITSKDKKISIGKEIKIEARDGGKINFKYNDK